MQFLYLNFYLYKFYAKFYIIPLLLLAEITLILPYLALGKINISATFSKWIGENKSKYLDLKMQGRLIILYRFKF